MKTKSILLIAFVALLFFSLSLVTSCKKDSMNSSNPSTSSEDVNANADRFQESEGISSDVDVIADQATEMHGIDMRLNSAADAFGILSCATDSNDTINHVMVIDFGTGCTGHNGHVRSGQIIIHYNGSNYFTPGFQRIITFNNYYIDNRHVEGTRTITNDGFDADNHLKWTIHAQDMRITRPNGTYHEWNSDRVRLMLAGDSTLTDPSDDIYSITGEHTVTNAAGKTRTSTIIEALEKKVICENIDKGKVKIQGPNHYAILDYGDGTCDKIATISIDGKDPRTILLR